MPDSAPTPTILLFAQYIQRTEAGEGIGFDEFCGEHPGQAEALREHKANYDALHGVLKHVLPPATLSYRIKDKYGDDVDPDISLKGEDEGSSDLSAEVIQRLSSRGEGYGRYRLKGEIDRGGQGAVLRVWDEDL